MQDINSKLTFFVNKASGTYFLLDIKGKTLNSVSNSDVAVLNRYKHLMGFEGSYRTFSIPDYNVMKKFKKLLSSLDLSSIDRDIAEYLIDSYPEYFI